jgi:TRAP-type mannitol/chloroaromatic compound transport system substrate-binding protein
LGSIAAMAATASAQIASAVASPALAQSPVRWRMTHFADETSMFYVQTAPRLVERVRQLTGGRVQIQPFPGGVISPPLESYKAVEDGLADAGLLTPLYLVGRDPVNSFYGGHPGGMPPEMLLHWLYEGGGADLLAQHRRATMNMHAIPVSMGPAEIWHSHRPLTKPEDLRGMRFRTSGAWALILNEYFGAAATTVPGAEVYLMLERRGVDAAEWSGPAENLNAGLHNAAPFITLPGTHLNAFTFELIMPARRWDPLPDDAKRLVEAAAKLATIECLMSLVVADMDAMRRIRQSRVQIVAAEPSLITAIHKAGRDWAMKRVAEQDARNNQWMRRITESYYSFYDRWLSDANYRKFD